MREHRLLSGVLALLLLASAAAAGGLEAGLADTISTGISPAGDTDDYAFEAAEGSTLAVSVAAAKGSGLVPVLMLFDPAGLPVSLDPFLKASGGKASFKTGLTATGTFTLRVGGADDTTGGYLLRIKGKLPKSIKVPERVLPAGGTLDVEFSGTATADVTVKVKASKEAAFRVLSVYDPAGREAPGGLAAFAPDGTARQAVFRLFGAFGTYGLRFGGAAADTPLAIQVKIAMPKPAKRFREFTADEPRPGALSAATAAPGAQIVVTGEGFAPGCRLFFGAAEVTPVTRIDSTELRATVPAAAARGAPLDVAVRNPDGQENALAGAFTVLTPPTVAGFNAARIEAGDVVTVLGTGFQPGASVRFNGIPSPDVDFVSSSALTAEVPAGLAEGAVTVRVDNPDGLWGARTGSLFVETEPTVTGVDPDTAWRGEAVRILGSGFVSGASVGFGAVPAASVGFVDAGELIAVVPANLAYATHDVTVTKPYGTSATLADALTVVEDVRYKGLLITGMVDGPRSGGLPKAIELYATWDIPDLSVYALENASNGAAFSAPEFVLTGSAVRGQYLYVAYESTGFEAYFGFAPDFTDAVANNNGNDAVALYRDGELTDVCGDPSEIAGSTDLSASWCHQDGFIYRADASGPDVAHAGTDWICSGNDYLDVQGSSGVNGDAGRTVPFGTWYPE